MAGSWFTCPSSITSVKSPLTDAAKEGIFLHNVIEFCIKNEFHPSSYSEYEYVGNGKRFFEENNMLSDDHVKLLTPVFNKVMEYIDNGWQFRTEFYVSFEKILNVSRMRGVIDLILFKETSIMIVDFKFGGRLVPVKNNMQLLIYTIAAIAFFVEKYGYAPPTVFNVISQPRVTDNEWSIIEVNKHDMESFTVKLKKALILCMENHLDDNKTYLPEHRSCSTCSRRFSCSSMLTNSIEILEQYQHRKNTMLADDLSYIIAKAPFIKSVIASAESAAASKLKSGGKVEGLKLIGGIRRRKWLSKPDDVSAKLHHIGLEDSDIYDKRLCSPASIIGKVGKDKKELVSELWCYNESPERVTIDSDSRKSSLECIVDQFKGI